MGRPSDYTDAIADEICDAIADGASLRAICEADDMPNRKTVLRWLERYTDFAAKYARAREAQADVMDDRILQTADTCTPENAAAARVKIDAFKWRAEKLKPKVYGSKTLVGSDPDNPLPSPLDMSALSTAALKELAKLAPNS